MATAGTARVYRRAARKVVIMTILAALLGVFGLHNAGYGVWVGGGPTGDTRNDLVLLNCRYFTGTEKIINHVWKKSEETTARCPLLARFSANRDSFGGDVVRPPS